MSWLLPMREVSNGGKVRVVPLTFPRANECVALWHRHHAPLPGGFAWYCLGARGFAGSKRIA